MSFIVSIPSSEEFTLTFSRILNPHNEKISHQASFRSTFCTGQSYSTIGNFGNRSFKRWASNNNDPVEVTEDLDYLTEEFQRLTGGKAALSYQAFVNSGAIQSLLADDQTGLHLDEIAAMWKGAVGALETPADLDAFIAINREIDESFEYIEDEDEVDELDEENRNIEADEVTGQVLEVKDIDVWDKEFSCQEYFGLDFVNYLKNWYDENAKEDGLKYVTFAAWSDVKQMLAAGQVDAGCLKDLWAEALEEKIKRKIGGDEGIEQAKKGLIDFDTFSRMNVRLDAIMDEIQEALGNLTDEEVEQYYRDEFSKLAEGEPLMSYGQLTEWVDIKELIEGEAITMEQINNMWEALPKRPLGSFHRKKGFAKVVQSDGIDVDSFLAFNTALEDFLNSAVSE
jgi:hypothetical protein